MKDKNKYVACCSFGKDSIATILLAHEHGDPLDEIIFSEVMYDHKRNISGEHQVHIDFIHNVAIPYFKNLGYKITILKSDKDFLYYFFKVMKRGKYIGKLYGFPLSGRCVINDRCKVGPIKKYLKGKDIMQYVGIAIDEPKRLARLTDNKISLLSKYNYTEKMAYDLCESKGLLSPIYKFSHRGGCWFCPNAKMEEFKYTKKTNPIIWREFVNLGDNKNLASKQFNYHETIKDIDERI